MRFELNRKQLFRFRTINSAFTLFAIFLPMVFPFLMISIIEGQIGLSLRSAAILFSLIGLATFSMLGFMVWHADRFVKALEYQVDNHILHINEGVFVFKKKAIPMDRVTDIQLVQGLIMRWLGIWKIMIQTASSGQTSPEGVLWAINKPEVVRNELLQVRNTAVKSQQIDIAS